MTWKYSRRETAIATGGEKDKSVLDNEALARLADANESAVGEIPRGGEFILESLEPWDMPRCTPEKALAIGQRFARLVIDAPADAFERRNS